MNIKLIAIDMDGTTISSDQTLSVKNKNIIEEAIRKGIIVVPATGRMSGEIPLEVQQIEGIEYMITSNGASVIDKKNNNSLYKNLIPHEIALKMMKILIDYGVFLEVYSEGEAIMQTATVEELLTYGVPEEFAELMLHYRTVVDDLYEHIKNAAVPIEKINVSFNNSELRDKVWNEFLQIKEVKITSSYKDNMEINNSTANKADGLAKLCEYLNISRENVMAIGDSSNDVDMLKFAGVSIAMANATDEVKELADHITLSNNDSGVAYAIEKYSF
ncbi:MAG: hypothetical protein K0R15_820 [Clostridiales bacterium]|jgi:Cof subfamily protein (haloacid dehalogenase superfamily)|nr:hypothetical protein [Clostridiales bacterium]